MGSTLETQPTARLEPIGNTRSRRSHAAQSECAPQGTAESARQQATSLKKQQTGKKPDESFYVDNDYYALNPWYDQEPNRPLFGLGRPFPRTVRPGMLWGRRGLRGSMYRVEGPQREDEQEQGGQSGSIGSGRRSPASIGIAFLISMLGKMMKKMHRLWKH